MEYLKSLFKDTETRNKILTQLFLMLLGVASAAVLVSCWVTMAW